ncbi:uncharacterized protein LOC128638278 isoform X2 [Bombina bombina]|uniref:uncharacterized protein LOC128638278 isoform X2 n=1 Tax=Bombina bombina TaxID=8345 RepID=UPI00235A9237|nr:uncharacterized protein LOC128638278 isoform X2 [Bombina bombina]
MDTETLTKPVQDTLSQLPHNVQETCVGLNPSEKAISVENIYSSFWRVINQEKQTYTPLPSNIYGYNSLVNLRDTQTQVTTSPNVPEEKSKDNNSRTTPFPTSLDVSEEKIKENTLRKSQITISLYVPEKKSKVTTSPNVSEEEIKENTLSTSQVTSPDVPEEKSKDNNLSISHITTTSPDFPEEKSKDNNSRTTSPNVSEEEIKENTLRKSQITSPDFPEEKSKDNNLSISHFTTTSPDVPEEKSKDNNLSISHITTTSPDVPEEKSKDNNLSISHITTTSPDVTEEKSKDNNLSISHITTSPDVTEEKSKDNNLSISHITTTSPDVTEEKSKGSNSNRKKKKIKKKRNRKKTNITKEQFERSPPSSSCLAQCKDAVQRFGMKSSFLNFGDGYTWMIVMLVLLFVQFSHVTCTTVTPSEIWKQYRFYADNKYNKTDFLDHPLVVILNDTEFCKLGVMIREQRNECNNSAWALLQNDTYLRLFTTTALDIDNLHLEYGEPPIGIRAYATLGGNLTKEDMIKIGFATTTPADVPPTEPITNRSLKLRIAVIGIAVIVVLVPAIVIICQRRLKKNPNPELIYMRDLGTNSTITEISPMVSNGNSNHVVVCVEHESQETNPESQPTNHIPTVKQIKNPRNIQVDPAQTTPLLGVETNSTEDNHSNEISQMVSNGVVHPIAAINNECLTTNPIPTVKRHSTNTNNQVEDSIQDPPYNMEKKPTENRHNAEKTQNGDVNHVDSCVVQMPIVIHIE